MSGALESVSELVLSARPDWEIGSVEPLGEGDFSSAYLVNRRWVFRFAKHARVALGVRGMTPALDRPDDALVASTRAYYDERADDYGDESKPSDRKVRGLMGAELGGALVDELRPTGDVLELACGTGAFTRESSSSRSR